MKIGLVEDWKFTFLSLTFDYRISKRNQVIWLAFILLICVALRLMIIDVPALDRTMWKEIDYIEISKNYMQNNYDFLRPEISWPAEPPRVTAMELPVVPFMAGLLYPILGFNAFSVRIIPLISWILLTVYVFLLVRREAGPAVALVASFASALMPIGHRFGNILFSEPTVIAMSTMSLYHFAEWIDYKGKKDYILAAIGFSLAVSLKLTPLYMILPLYWVLLRKYGFQFRKYGSSLLLFFVSMSLPLAWYAYAYYLTQSSIDVFGIFGGHDKMQTLTMLSDISWYRNMAYQVGNDILGGKVGTVFFVIGISASLFLKRGYLFIVYLFTIGCFFAIVAEGQIDAPYRQLTIVPSASFFSTMGVYAIYSLIAVIIKTRQIPKEKLKQANLSHISLAICSVILALVFQENISQKLRVQPNLPADTIKWDLSKIIKTHSRENNRLILLGEYSIHKGGNDLSPVLSYYAARKGWILQKPEWNMQTIETLKKKNATLLVAIRMKREQDSKTFMKKIRGCYRIVYEDKERDLLVVDVKTSEC